MPIEYKKEGPVAIFTINNPEVMNALTPDQLAAWTDTLLDFRDDRDLRVAIITGAGDKAFCAGLNLSSSEEEIDFFPRNTLVRGLQLYKPLIAAINGYAFGGGLEIALACDIRIAAEQAQLGLTEVTLGIIPGWGGTQRLPRIVPLGVAAQMMMMGKRVSAREALEIRLVHEIVPPGDLMKTARTYAERFCELAPLAVMGAKEVMLKGIDMSLEQGLELESLIDAKLIASKDFLEGRTAFAEKRKPDFKGK